MSQTIEYEFNGHRATVIRPEHPNGKWIWKTEFLYAFDAAEAALVEEGYTRVYYSLCDMYGSGRAVRLMHQFHLDLLTRYPLCQQATLFGFSRGGLYAFNYALYYPEYVDRIYLDAPVLNLRSWPHPDQVEQQQMLDEYGIKAQTLPLFHDSPNDHLDEFFSYRIPLLLIAGGQDPVVPLAENGGVLMDYAQRIGRRVTYYLKPNCSHHPHSLEDVSPILDFLHAERETLL